MANPLMQEGIWFDKCKADDAERLYQENRAKELSGLVVKAVAPSNQSESSDKPDSGLAGQIARARQNIQNTLNSGVGLGIGVTVDSPELSSRLAAVEKENAELRQITADLQSTVSKLTARVNALDTGSATSKPSTPAATKQEKPAAPVEDDAKEEDDDDDDSDFDMFGDEDDDDEDFAAMQDRKKKEMEESKKSKKVVIAKSSILLDVKPWDDETDMVEVEKLVRTIKADGLLWGASKLVPIAYGIQKLQICCVVEDDKVGTDFLEEEIKNFEDKVQSVDIAAFNKI